MRFYTSDQLGRARKRPEFFDDPAFCTFLEGLPEGAALIELDDRLRQVNAQMERLLKTPRADLLGSDMTRHLRGTGGLCKELSEGLIRLRRVEAQGRFASGRAVSANLSILRMAGEAYGALLILSAPQTGPQAEGPSQFRFSADQKRPSPWVESPKRAAIARQIGLGLAQGMAIMLQGETGTGKSALLARLCAARGGAVVSLRCAQLHEGNFDQEMFGATETRAQGHLEAAAGGVLILEGVDDLSPALQGRLLAVLDRGAGAQIVSTSRAPLAADGPLRDDLYFRLAEMTLSLPQLRADPEFIAPLREAWLTEINHGRAAPLALSAGFCKALAARPLRGNIRELVALLRAAACTAPETGTHETATPDHLPPLPAPLPFAEAEAGSLKSRVDAFELRTIQTSIAQHGSKRSAAKALGIDVATLIRKETRSRDSDPTRRDP